MTSQYYITKKAGDKIMEALPGILKECNFEALPADNWHEYKKQSIGGMVEITIRFGKSVVFRGYSICIFGRFADPGKALAAGIDCNQFSGKSNHHFIQTIEQLRHYLNQYK